MSETNLDNSMAAPENEPLAIEHTRILQALTSCQVVLKGAKYNNQHAVDYWNAGNKPAFQQSWAAVTALISAAQKILDEVLPQE